MKPFDGLNKFKERCRAYDTTAEVIPQPRYDAVVEDKPIVVNTIVPRSGLYDIYKRSTDQTINKCVGIGFKYLDAKEFIKKRLKTKEMYDEKYVVFYDVVEQGNIEQQNPLWNPKEFTKEGGSEPLPIEITRDTLDWVG